MNQILVTEKLYVTPELKRKKKIYKLYFFLSVFLVCSLFSFYIYAEYDRNKNEEISREILSSIDLAGTDEKQTDDTTVRIDDNVLIVTLGEEESNEQEIDITKLARDAQNYIQEVEEQAINNVIEEEPAQQETYTTETGATYTTNSILNIPSLGINYPI